MSAINSLILFAASRIQEQEQLPSIDPELADNIKALADVIVCGEGDVSEDMLAEFITMLEGVPATYSLSVVLELLESPHHVTVGECIEQSRAASSRVEYFYRLEALAELFTPARVGRIQETVTYMHAGMGW